MKVLFFSIADSGFNKMVVLIRYNLAIMMFIDIEKHGEHGVL